jgi:hypothetical protein
MGISIKILLRSIELALLCVAIYSNSLWSQEIRQYVVKHTATSITIDGHLTEADWQAAAFSEKFVHYQDGSQAKLSTQVKYLWDDQYLYIGFICQDPDVWATMTERDDRLWHEDVVEIFCDPDGDGLNYCEIQVNPLGTILDIFFKKPFYNSGYGNRAWNLDSLKVGVSVQGTLNNKNDIDTGWTVEVAIPFKELKFMAPSMNFPPHDGDRWRILTARYDYQRTEQQTVEASSWNQTSSVGGFHVPSKFGSIIFSKETVTPIDSIK